MQPLIGQSLYERLNLLRDEMIRKKIGTPAAVFVPVGAPLPSRPLQMPRVLFVGKATRDYVQEAEPETLTVAAEAAVKVINAWLLPGRSAFWQLARAILNLVAQDCNQPAGNELLHHFGWSNLAKIGDVNGNLTLCPSGRRGTFASRR